MFKKPLLDEAPTWSLHPYLRTFKFLHILTRAFFCPFVHTVDLDAEDIYLGLLHANETALWILLLLIRI
jgi:hypothetical protein